MSAGENTARERLVLAAVDVMQEKTPAQIRGREIAERAQVNYGLIHHYFGSKNALLRAGLERLVSDFVADRPGTPYEVASPIPVSTASAHGRLWNVLANVAGDPDALDALGWDYPVLRRVLAQAQARFDPDDAMAIKGSIAAAATLTLGWMTYQNFVRQALELSDDELAQVNSSVTDLADELWTADPQALSRRRG